MPLIGLHERPQGYSVTAGVVYGADARYTENRVEHEHPRHEKIRFRRDEITDLATLPSAAVATRPARQWLPKRTGTILLRVAGAAAALVLLVLAAIYAIGVSGIGSERLRIAAEKALEDAAGIELDASVGPARITLDGGRFLALEVRDVSLKRTSDGKAIAEAGAVRLGVRLLPLLSGDVRVSSASLSDARIMVEGMRSDEGADWTAVFRNEAGLVEPARVADTVFESAHRALNVMGSKSLRRIALDNVELVLPAGEGIASIRVVESELSEARGDSLAFSSELEVGGRAVEVAASASRDGATRLISSLRLTASSPDARRSDGDGGRLGAVELELSGAEGGSGEQPQLNATLKLANSAVDLGTRGVLSGDLDLAARFAGGADRVEIERLHASIGRSEFDFRGLVGPRPATGEPGDSPAYRFNLVSNRSSIAPEGSPEPAMITALQLAGTYLTEEKVLSASEIFVKGGRGEALGTASMRFVEGQAPGISVAFNVHDMPVSQVKQLWPWFAARGARNWVLNNVFGGRVSEAQLQYRVEPGRAGNGVPLSANESFGTFRLEGTRFDTAGLIPPVRDATGVVDYKGNDVDIALSSGTVFLPSGRTVAASNGMLAVKQANVPPVVGALDIDVAGEAAAVVELASYDPINAMRYVGLAPEDFTGQVSGNVKADIPLQKGVSRDRLDWLVALDYTDLSLAKPVDGQMVSEAEGSITVEKTKAVIAAKARLGGVPASIDAIEPLGGSEIERKRLIGLTLDEKMRETLVPGLSDMVKGPVRVVLDSREGGRLVEADLTDAQLIVPWAGWTKGPGIAGSVSFVLENADGKSTLSDFNLSGATFGVVGSVALSDGSLSEAQFSKARLNRNDDVSVSVKQSGKGYAVAIKGKSLDARSVVRQFTADSDTATKAAESGSVSVDVDVDSVTGFNDERLGGLKLQYRGSGSRVDRLEVTATTGSGAPVQLRNGAEGGGRAMRMTSTDAGALLRFLDIYKHMEGGVIELALQGAADGPMTGQVDARNFVLVNEPRLSSIVSTTPPGGDRSLNQAVKRDIDTSRVNFERCYSQIEKGAGYLRLSNGVLRGPLVGASFQGMLYDPKGNMDMTGTFMPAYGLNRIFGEIPIIGVLLGNGRDRGLIGVTFKLEGDADSPAVQINPLSVIAPGIFRSIFEFR